MRKIILASFVIIILFSINMASALACSCSSVSMKESLENSTAIFAGKVVEIRIPRIFISSADPVKIIFDVSTVWKGSNFKTIIVETARMGVSCGYSFKEGQKYLVYARGEEDDLKVGLCGRTKLLIDADEDLNELSKGFTPTIENHNVSYDLNFFYLFILIVLVVITILVLKIYKKDLKNNK